MTRRTLYLPLLMIMLLLCAPAFAAQTGNDLVKAELIADTTAIRAGQPFRVAVKFNIEPHWHIYWSNPGETGQATKVKLELPEGFTAADVQYPAPRRFVAAGDIVGFGYENETVLMATITPPATLDGASQTIAASVSWLVCSEDLCLPGKTKLSLSLPVNAEPEPANAALFKKWSARVPVAIEEAREVVSAVAKPPDADSTTHTFTVNWSHAPAAVDWFPPAVSVVNFDDVDVKTDGQQTVITASATPLAGQKLPGGTLESVIVYKDTAGETRGIIVPFELTPAKGSPDKVSQRD